MNKKELLNRINTTGIWMVNKDGYFLKAWKENNHIILRAYCENEKGEWIPETYKKKEEDIRIEETNGRLHLSLSDEWIDNMDESACVSDQQADKEYLAGTTSAVEVENTLATAISIETCDEDIKIFQ